MKSKMRHWGEKKKHRARIFRGDVLATLRQFNATVVGGLLVGLQTGTRSISMLMSPPPPPPHTPEEMDKQVVKQSPYFQAKTKLPLIFQKEAQQGREKPEENFRGLYWGRGGGGERERDLWDGRTAKSSAQS